MTHQCLKCERTYDDDVVPILEGCECSSRLFVYSKQGHATPVTEEVRTEIEEKIREIEADKAEEDPAQQKLAEPVVETSTREVQSAPEVSSAPSGQAKANKPGRVKRFGIETIKVQDVGVYQINLDALMKGQPIVVLAKSGSYIISLPSVFGGDESVRLG